MLWLLPVEASNVGVALPRCVINAAFDTLFDTLSAWVTTKNAPAETTVGVGPRVLNHAQRR